LVYKETSNISPSPLSPPIKGAENNPSLLLLLDKGRMGGLLPSPLVGEGKGEGIFGAILELTRKKIPIFRGGVV